MRAYRLYWSSVPKPAGSSSSRRTWHSEPSASISRQREPRDARARFFAQDGEEDEIFCGPGNDVAYRDPPPPGGESPYSFLDDSCETIDDTVD